MWLNIPVNIISQLFCVNKLLSGHIMRDRCIMGNCNLWSPWWPAGENFDTVAGLFTTNKLSYAKPPLALINVLLHTCDGSHPVWSQTSLPEVKHHQEGAHVAKCQNVTDCAENEPKFDDHSTSSGSLIHFVLFETSWCLLASQTPYSFWPISWLLVPSTTAILQL